MALTVQNVVDDVSIELRKVLDGTGGSGDDFNLILRWVDQTHKDLLHTGIYRHVLRKQTTVTSTAGTRSYAITPTDVRRIEAVYSRPQELFLSSIADALPTVMADVPDQGHTGRPDKFLATFRASTPYPQYYWLQTTVTSGTPAHTLFIAPAPLAAEHAGTVDIYYIKQAATVAAAATALDAGEDSRDAMVAGVLARAYRYFHDFEASAYWKAIYEEMKLGETV